MIKFKRKGRKKNLAYAKEIVLSRSSCLGGSWVKRFYGIKVNIILLLLPCCPWKKGKGKKSPLLGRQNSRVPCYMSINRNVTGSRQLHMLVKCIAWQDHHSHCSELGTEREIFAQTDVCIVLGR